VTKFSEIYAALDIENPEKFKIEFDSLNEEVSKLKKSLSEKTKTL
jgi:hypothetical protein